MATSEFKFTEGTWASAAIKEAKAKGSFIQRNIDLNLIDSVGMGTYNSRLKNVPSFVWNKNDN